MSEQSPVTTVPTSKGISPKQIVGLVIGVLAVIFVFQNTKKGSIHFLFWTMTMPGWVWLLLVFVAGVAVGLLLPRMRASAKRKRASAAEEK